MSAMPTAVVQTALPLIALVGRPNVGKSTLFNRLVGGHNAIVEDKPGVTRDRRYGNADFDGKSFRVVDTGGLDFAAKNTIGKSVLRQSLKAIEEAALVIFVVDGQQGVMPEDRDVAETLRRTGKPLLLVANKIDGPRQEEGIVELYRLGIRKVYGISAAHGRGLPDFLDAIVETLREQSPEPQVAVHQEPLEHTGQRAGKKSLRRRRYEEATPLPGAAHLNFAGQQGGEASELLIEESDDEVGDDAAALHQEAADEGPIPDEKPDVIRIALVGRPNAGKSSLVNALCGEERMIVDSTPGTTRDPVDTLIEYQGQRYLIIDTAGIRRRAKVHEPMEKVAVAMAEKAVNRADIAVLVIDGSAGIGEQDAKIAGLVADAGKGLIIAFNKRDLLTPKDEKRLDENRQRQLQFIPWALQLYCSANSKRGVSRLLHEAQRCYKSYARRVSTGALNRFFAGIVQKHPPPLHNGKPIRLYYITQAQTKPPTFIMSVNHAEGMHFSYHRYLQNQLRETFAFVGTTVRLIARGRSRPPANK